MVNACSDIPLPEALTGKVKYSSKKKRFMYVKPLHNLPMFDDIITLAEHCFIHGICGKIDDEEDRKRRRPLTEFDACKYMEQARIHLGISSAESENLTMTEFARMMAAKFPPQRDENVASKKEQREMIEWLEQQNGVQ